jgi:hypothetical protein
VKKQECALIYLIGSLRNPQVPIVGHALRREGYDIFDDWYAVGPKADDHWKEYEKARGRNMKEALAGEAAKNTFRFDKNHLDASDAAVLVSPAGKSGHLELGYMLGKGKPGFVLLDEDPERWDVMYQFANAICFGLDDLIETLAGRIPRYVR